MGYHRKLIVTEFQVILSYTEVSSNSMILCDIIGYYRKLIVAKFQVILSYIELYTEVSIIR